MCITKGIFLICCILLVFSSVLFLSLLEYLYFLSGLSLFHLSNIMSLLSFLSENCNIPYKFSIFSERFHLFVALTKTRLSSKVKFSMSSLKHTFLFLLTSHIHHCQKVRGLPAWITLRQSCLPFH